MQPLIMLAEVPPLDQPPESAPSEPMPVGRRAQFRFGSNDRLRLESLRKMNGEVHNSSLFRLALRMACNVDFAERQQYILRGVDAKSDGAPGLLYVWLEDADRLLMEKVQHLYDLETPSEAVRWAIKLATERTAAQYYARAKKKGK